jgi:FkbM family methyltransferase
LKSIIKKNIFPLLEKFIYSKGVKKNISGIELRLPFIYRNYYELDYEKDSVLAIRTLIKKGDIILDVGAQMGLMTVLFNKLSGKEGKVLSYEPTPSTYKILSKTLELNNISSVTIQKAVSDKNGIAFFNISEQECDAANSLSQNSNRKSNNQIEVIVTSIDNEVMENKLEKLNFIKIDAEGAEYKVLLGASLSIDNFKPTILLALHPKAINDFGDTLELIWNYIELKEYDIFENNLLLKKEDFCSRVNLFDVFLFSKNKK